MKKIVMALMVTALFTAAVPVMAVEQSPAQIQQDKDSARECDILLSECGVQLDSIQQRIKRIEVAIKKYGAKPGHVEELKILNQKLKDANDSMRALTEPGH